LERLIVAEKIENTESRRTYFLAAFLAPLIWGFMSIPVRWVRDWSADDILNYRILSGLLILWGYILVFRRKALKQDLHHFRELEARGKRNAVGLTLFASICIFGNWYTYIYAINNISVQSAAFGYMICPLITTFAAFIILKEQLSVIKWIALALALISVGLLASGSLIDGLWSLGIASLYAFYLISQRVLQGFDKLNVLAVQLAICSLFIIPILFIQGHPLPHGTTFWTSIILIAVVFTIIPLFLSMYALSKISSSTTGVLLYVNPIIAFLLAIFFFKEEVDPHKYMAYGILIVAIMLFNSTTLRSMIRR
jgi:chloramphenicol-sensitive protein RarD